MTITSQTTRQGKVIHRLLLGDLVDAVESGQRLRASCPIHGGDHQRSLSIDRATGWGYCHCCHATVLVDTRVPLIVGGGGNTFGRRGTSGHTLSPPPYIDHPPPSSLRPDLLRQGRAVTPLPGWQHEEVAALRAVTSLMRASLTSSRWAQVYLNERGIPAAIAHAANIGYLSRCAWEQAPVPAEQRSLLKRWIGRIIFPLGSPRRRRVYRAHAAQVGSRDG